MQPIPQPSGIARSLCKFSHVGCSKTRSVWFHARGQLGDLRIAPGKPRPVINGAQLRGVSSILVIRD